MNLEIGPGLKEVLMSKSFHDDLAGLGIIIFFLILIKIISKTLITIHQSNVKEAEILQTLSKQLIKNKGKE